MTNTEIRNSYHNKEIRPIAEKLGPICFHMGLSVLLDWGHRHITKEFVEEKKAQIMEEAKANPNDNSCVFSPETDCYLFDIALELAQFTAWDLVAYVKTDVDL